MSAVIVVSLLLLLCLCAWHLFSQRRRMLNLARHIESCLTGDATVPVSVHDDQLATLENAVSELSLRLSQCRANAREDAQKLDSLIVDLSHQLKTPLASLRLFCELDAPAHADKMLDSIDRMERLVYSVLRLERLRAGSYSFDFHTHSLSAIAREAWAELAALYPERSVFFSGDARIRCDAQWLGTAGPGRGGELDLRYWC